MKGIDEVGYASRPRSYFSFAVTVCKGAFATCVLPLMFLAAPGEVLVVLAVQRNRRMHQFFPTASCFLNERRHQESAAGESGDKAKGPHASAAKVPDTPSSRVISDIASNIAFALAASSALLPLLPPLQSPLT